MPKFGGQLYQVNRPLSVAGRTIWQTQLLLIFVPLVIVAGYCAVYIQLHINQQNQLSKTLRQQTSEQTMSNLSSTLTTEPELPVVTTTNTPPANDQQTTSPQAATNALQYLENHWTDSLQVSNHRNRTLATPKPKDSPKK